MDAFSPRRFTIGYFVALAIIAGLSIISHLGLVYVFRYGNDNALLINISGRQRMLSQRIASMAAQYKLGNPAARTELITATIAFKQAYQEIIKQKFGEIINESYSHEFAALYFTGPASLNTQVQNYVSLAQRIAALSPTDPAFDGLLSQLFLAAKFPLLTNLEKAVTIQQKESEHTLSLLYTMQKIVLFIVLFTLFLEGYFIFRPMIHRVIKYTEELLRLAMLDYLTGIDNRRSFIEKATHEIRRAHRNKKPLALLMLDIDHFKYINDTFGHSAGDAVLKSITLTIKKNLRVFDIFGRIGGEEFAILLAETQLENALLLAERLRKLIENIIVTYNDKKIICTVSIGIAEVTTGLDQAIHLSDTALYKAKIKRNCVAVYSAELIKNSSYDSIKN